jgi:hypothetical protein
MKPRMILAALAIASGALLAGTTSGVSAVAAPLNQCWYEVGVDPENACTYCFDPCGGDGYKCCRIVVVEQ